MTAITVHTQAELDAALATLVRDLITPKQYDLLMAPWRTVIGDQA